jgi:hypothetical protein
VCCLLVLNLVSSTLFLTVDQRVHSPEPEIGGTKEGSGKESVQRQQEGERLQRERRTWGFTSLFAGGLDGLECRALISVIVVLVLDYVIFQKYLPLAFQLFFRGIVRVPDPARTMSIFVVFCCVWRGAIATCWCGSCWGLESACTSTEFAVAFQNTANFASLLE